MSGRAIEFTVLGKPAPQGSKIQIRHKQSGKPIILEDSRERVQTWRGAVIEAAGNAMQEAWEADGIWEPFTGPVALTCVFTFARPAGHYRTGRNSHLLRDGAPARPVSRNVGDLSKLVRATEDALTDAGLWKDDSLVAGLGETCKVYPGGHLRALILPGAWISVTEITGGPA